MSTKEKVYWQAPNMPQNKNVECSIITGELGNERSVSLGVLQDGSGDRVIIIESPTLDGKISVLQFGMKPDAADILTCLLIKAKEEDLKNS